MTVTRDAVRNTFVKAWVFARPSLPVESGVMRTLTAQVAIVLGLVSATKMLSSIFTPK